MMKKSRQGRDHPQTRKLKSDQ